jgi:hypothetical protein
MSAQLKFKVDAVFVGREALFIQPARRYPDEQAVDPVERGPRHSRSASR